MLNINGLTFDTFNSNGREINGKCEIYFDGENSAPVVISHNDYLVDMDVLEEAFTSSGTNPIGESSSNELDITLYDKTGIFNPANTQSIYASKIKRGLIIKPYLNCNGSAYAPLGVFSVADWDYNIATKNVLITAYDISYPIKKNDTFYLRSYANMYLSVFIQTIINTINAKSSYQYSVRSNTIVDKFLLCAYLCDNNLGSALTNMGISLLANIFTDRYGKFVFENFFNFNADTTSYKEITDDNQIYSASVKQDIIALPSSISVAYNAFAIEVTGVYSSDTVTTFASSLVLEIDTDATVLTIDSIILANSDCKVSSVVYAKHITVTLTGTHFDSIKINAKVVKSSNTSSVTIRNEGSDSDAISITGSLIQSSEAAQEYANKLLTYARTQVQLITVSAKGNPVIEIGDCIKVSSISTNLVLYGKVIRAKYTYDGGLKCTYTLINIKALGGDV